MYVLSLLIYVPPYITDDVVPTDPAMASALEVLVEQPAVAFADRVLVPSELMRVYYIEMLCIFAGQDTRPVWEKKIVTFPALRPGDAS